MKRFLLILLALLLALSALSLPSFAAERGRITLTGEGEGLARGDAFTLHVEVNRNPGVTGLLVTLTYDPKVFEITSTSEGALFPSFTEDRQEGKLILRWKAPAESPDLTDTGRAASVVFRIKENAPLGDAVFSAAVDERFLDAVNAKGQAVPFDTEGKTIHLECLHVRTETEVLTPPDFTALGAGTEKCLDCGGTWEKELLPTVSSADGAVTAEVNLGEYDPDDGKSMTLEYLYGGEDYEAAGTFFEDTLIRAFRVRFLKNGNVFFPDGESRLTLNASFDVPPDFALYIMVDGQPRKMEASYSEGCLSFLYSSYLFVVVSQEMSHSVTLPETDLPTVTLPEGEWEDAPSTSKAAEENSLLRDAPLLAAAMVAAALFLTGAVVVLRRGKRDRL